MATMKMPCAVGSSGGTDIVATEDSLVTSTTNILTLDGSADAYIINCFSKGSSYWAGNNISSVSSGTFEEVESYSYSDDQCKTWFVSGFTKGSTLTVTFQTRDATKWATALTID